MSIPYLYMSGIIWHSLAGGISRSARIHVLPGTVYMYWTTSYGVPGSAADYNRMAVYLTVERPRPNLYAS